MGNDLSIDELDALEQISKGLKEGRPTACVARNTKRLNGLKYIEYAKSGALSITDKGKQTLFIKRCIDGLRAVAGDPQAVLKSDVVTFLAKKGHIVANAADGFDITQKGRECLADIDAGGQ
ncbi:MAG TPA: hypothetical protein VGO72_02155 [Herminiimonas sp.]|jgi:predicted transcriptional regulator|nr:hypothetical protein [Herminiimonas sp.]